MDTDLHFFNLLFTLFYNVKKSNFLISTILFSLVLVLELPAQNSNLLFRNHSGAYSGMGETGIASMGTSSSFDINPALLCNYSAPTLSVYQSVTFREYSLLRMSSLVGAQTFDWNKTKLTLENGTIVYPISNELVLGAGLFLKLNPQLKNKKIAVTFSDLFAQETSGSVYAASISMGYKISESFSAGLSFYSYFGTITSYIVGDNHGKDADKWIKLENKLHSFNLKGGVLYKEPTFSVGLTIEIPHSMDLDADKSISSNPLYSYLFPKYDHTEWKQPLIIGCGISYSGIKEWLFEADFETRQYKNSNVQLNLYEFGGIPVWETVNILRVGVEYKTGSELGLPIRAGYELVPQLYYSNNSNGRGNLVTDYRNTDRVMKQVITAGTSIVKNNFRINLTFLYSFLSWNRIMIVPQTITDEYKERDFALSAEIVYQL